MLESRVEQQAGFTDLLANDKVMGVEDLSQVAHKIKDVVHWMRKVECRLGILDFVLYVLLCTLGLHFGQRLRTLLLLIVTLLELPFLRFQLLPYHLETLGIILKVSDPLPRVEVG